MKKVLLLVTLCFALLTGCGTVAEDPRASEELPVSPDSGTVAVEPGGQATVTAPPAELPDKGENSSILCRIVDGAEDGSLMLADADSTGMYRGSGVYRMSAENKTVYLDGKLASPDVLVDGMLVEVFFDGFVMESFPAQFGGVQYLSAWSQGSERDPGGSYYDLCGFYLKVLDDLWNEDAGLNSDVTVVGLDLSNAPGELTEGQKLALMWRFGALHGVEVVGGTFEELAEDYFTPIHLGDEVEEGPVAYEWTDGCLFVIEANEWEEGEMYSLPVLKFDAYKWRSPLGAYFFSDCTAVWPQFGTWSDYNVGARMIS